MLCPWLDKTFTSSLSSMYVWTGVDKLCTVWAVSARRHKHNKMPACLQRSQHWTKELSGAGREGHATRELEGVWGKEKAKKFLLIWDVLFCQ